MVAFRASGCKPEGFVGLLMGVPGGSCLGTPLCFQDLLCPTNPPTVSVRLLPVR